MICPCDKRGETSVVDSRPTEDGTAIRRRRLCMCGQRFTTFETIDLTIQVKKRDGSFQEFSQEKLVKGLDSACRHTRISHDQVVAIASDVAMDIYGSGVREIDTLKIGEIVMKKLCKLDPIAYVRFASVYRNFREEKDFITFVDRIDVYKKR